MPEGSAQMVMGELGKPHGYSSRYNLPSRIRTDAAYRLRVDLLAESSRRVQLALVGDWSYSHLHRRKIIQIVQPATTNHTNEHCRDSVSGQAASVEQIGVRLTILGTHLSCGTVHRSSPAQNGLSDARRAGELPRSTCVEISEGEQARPWQDCRCEHSDMARIY